MSRRSVMWKRKIGSQWTDRANKHHSSQAGGDVEKLLPVRAAKGTGKFLAGSPNGGSGIGKVVTRPMDPEKQMRIMELANPKKVRR